MTTTRNRPATEQKIRSAAADLLRKEGFPAYGLNVVARRAKVDKVLIYRYFSDAHGLLGSVLSHLQLWPDPLLLPEDPIEFLSETQNHLAADSLPMAFLAGAAGPRLARSAAQQFTRQHHLFLEALRQRTSGPWPDPATLTAFTARLLQSAVLPGIGSDSPRQLWNLLSPPLQSPARPSSPASEELPTELL